MWWGESVGRLAWIYVAWLPAFAVKLLFFNFAAW
jgi:hypothetical protein